MARDKSGDLEMLRFAVDLMDGLVRPEGAQHWDLAAPGSELAGDDEATAPLHTSHLLGHCLSMAEDQLRAIRILLTDHTGKAPFSLPMSAHYSNIRGVMEAASLAQWLLSPESRADRVVRSLQFRQYELVHERALYLSVTEPEEGAPPSEQRRLAKERQKYMKRHQRNKGLVRKVAERNGVDLGALPAFPGFGETAADAAKSMGMPGSNGRSMWQAVSGLTHPSTLRQVNMADHEVIAEDGDTLRVLFTASSLTLSASLFAAVNHFRAAKLLTEKRGGR